MEVNDGCIPTQLAEVDASSEYAACFMFNGVGAGGFIRILLKYSLIWILYGSNFIKVHQENCKSIQKCRL
jgi:hypothetical protein